MSCTSRSTTACGLRIFDYITERHSETFYNDKTFLKMCTCTCVLIQTFIGYSLPVEWLYFCQNVFLQIFPSNVICNVKRVRLNEILVPEWGEAHEHVYTYTSVSNRGLDRVVMLGSDRDPIANSIWAILSQRTGISSYLNNQ